MFASLDAGEIIGLPAKPSGLVILIPAVLVSVRATTVVLVSFTMKPVPALFKLPAETEAAIVHVFVPLVSDMFAPATKRWLFGSVAVSLFTVVNVWVNEANTEPASVVPPVELVRIK